MYLWCITEDEGVVAYETPTDNKNRHHIYILFHRTFTRGLILVCRLLALSSFSSSPSFGYGANKTPTCSIKKKQQSCNYYIDEKEDLYSLKGFFLNVIAAGVVGKVAEDVKCAWNHSQSNATEN